MSKISIALCTYNGAKYLSEQLESYARQIRLPDELVICDDKSNDQTVQIIEEFARRVSFPVRLSINENNLGYIKNFEKAITLCTGDLIFLSDQDDVWHSEKLEIFERKFTEQPSVGMVFCNARLVGENLEPLGVDVWQWLGLTPEVERLFNEGKGLAKIFNRNYSPGFTIAFRSEYKDLILPIPDDVLWVLHDYWIALLLTAATKVLPVQTPLVDYRQHGKQQIGAKPAFAETASSAAAGFGEKNNYLFNFARLEALQKRLRERENRYDFRAALAQANEGLHHFQVRDKLQNGDTNQISNFARELFSLRYHQYSTGFRSISKDLFLLATNLMDNRKTNKI